MKKIIAVMLLMMSMFMFAETLEKVTYGNGVYTGTFKENTNKLPNASILVKGSEKILRLDYDDVDLGRGVGQGSANVYDQFVNRIDTSQNGGKSSILFYLKSQTEYKILSKGKEIEITFSNPNAGATTNTVVVGNNANRGTTNNNYSTQSYNNNNYQNNNNYNTNRNTYSNSSNDTYTNNNYNTNANRNTYSNSNNNTYTNNNYNSNTYNNVNKNYTNNPNTNVYTPAPTRTGNKKYTIIVDPGHGGHDSGAVANGYREKDIALEVAKRLARNLSADYNVITTRDSDYFVTLDERPAIGNRVNADFFISIHLNSGGSSANGAEVYYYSKTGSSDYASEVAKFENRVDESYGSSPFSDYVLKDIFYKVNQEKSAAIAESVLDGIINTTGLRRRGVKGANFAVLRGSNSPAILAEIGFISNYSDLSKYLTPEGQENVASAIADAIRRHFR